VSVRQRALPALVCFAIRKYKARLRLRERGLTLPSSGPAYGRPLKSNVSRHHRIRIAMSTKKPESNRAELPENVSGLRRLVADANGAEYSALRSLSEARTFNDSTVILEGDYGGQIYVVAPVVYVKCNESRLHSLLAKIDATQWDEPEGASIFFERLPVGAAVFGGMGGAAVQQSVWVHERLQAHRVAIAAVLAGECESIHQ